MGKINGCLKCLFIFFNVLFAILGCLLIFGAVRSSTYSHQLSAVGGPSLGWGWVFAIGVLGISCLGIYAGCSEKGLALKIFAGFMGIGMVIMLIFGIVVAVTRNKAQCCGVVSASDWGDTIPQSCECSSAGYGAFGTLGGYGCTSKPAGTTGPDRIYKQPCSDIIFAWLDLFFKIAMGLFFGFAVTALLGLLVSLLMIHQVKRHDGAGGPSIAMKGY